MALIDILKLNEELDKMIATQDAEVKRIDAEIAKAKEERFKIFQEDMRSYAEIAEAICPNLSMFCGSFKDEYDSRYRSYNLIFSKANHMMWISWDNALGDTTRVCCIGYYQPHKENTMLGGSSIVDQIAQRYVEDPTRFEQDFRAACTRALRRKAEKANAKYQAAFERKEQANV